METATTNTSTDNGGAGSHMLVYVCMYVHVRMNFLKSNKVAQLSDRIFVARGSARHSLCESIFIRESRRSDGLVAMEMEIYCLINVFQNKYENLFLSNFLTILYFWIKYGSRLMKDNIALKFSIPSEMYSVF